jgi:hypothetical protein
MKGGNGIATSDTRLANCYWRRTAPSSRFPQHGNIDTPAFTAVAALDFTCYNGRMPTDTDTTRNYVGATDPANNEQTAFECIGLPAANAKAAELRMNADKDVIMSVATPSEDDDTAY